MNHPEIICRTEQTLIRNKDVPVYKTSAVSGVIGKSSLNGLEWLGKVRVFVNEKGSLVISIRTVSWEADQLVRYPRQHWRKEILLHGPDVRIENMARVFGALGAIGHSRFDADIDDRYSVLTLCSYMGPH